MKKHCTRCLSTLLLRPFFLLLLLQPLLLLSGLGNARAESVPAASNAPQIEVHMQKVDGRPQFEVNATFTVNATQARSWNVLTDYNRLAQFVPNLNDSHVVARDGNIVIVSQSGYARFLFLKQRVDLQLQVTEQPMEHIDIHRISGTMRTYEARWVLQELPEGGTRITYSGVITPDFYVPSLFGSALMKSDLHSMLDAVKAEIEKSPPQSP